DDPCWVLLSSTGLLARTSDDSALPRAGERAKHDVVVSTVKATARADVGVVTSHGRVVRLSVLDLPALPNTASAPNLAGGAPVAEFLDLGGAERALALVDLEDDTVALALGTAAGVVKRVAAESPPSKDSWSVISLKDGDEVIGAVALTTGGEELVFVTAGAQLLHFPASSVRPQGRPAGGMAGVKLVGDDRVVFFGALDPSVDGQVVTVSGSSAALPGTDAGSVKVTPFSEYPAKGRATGGVRCHRFLRGEDILLIAWAGVAPARAAAATGVPVALPDPVGRRDGSGIPGTQPIAAVAGSG
ncbi:MAG: DNA gyrase C-terminal beta-propeller domain-containing protein, partial [Actinomycetes bacterium]